MKKTLVILLIGIMSFGLVACSNNTITNKPQTSTKDEIVNDEKLEDKDENTKIEKDEVNEISSNFTNYEVLINGEKISFPSTYDDVIKLTGDGSYMYDYEVKPNVSNYGGLYKDSINNHIVDLYYKNISEEYLDCKKCSVIGISQNDTCDIEDTNVVITFSGGLRLGDNVTQDELYQLFGEPTKNEGEEFWGENTYQLWWYENGDKNDGVFMVRVEYDTIASIVLVNYN